MSGDEGAVAVRAGVRAYGGSRGPEGAGYFDGGLNAGHFDGPATEGPDSRGANLTGIPLRGPL